MIFKYQIVVETTGAAGNKSFVAYEFKTFKKLTEPEFYACVDAAVTTYMETPDGEPYAATGMTSIEAIEHIPYEIFAEYGLLNGGINKMPSIAVSENAKFGLRTYTAAPQKTPADYKPRMLVMDYLVFAASSRWPWKHDMNELIEAASEIAASCGDDFSVLNMHNAVCAMDEKMTK